MQSKHCTKCLRNSSSISTLSNSSNHVSAFVNELFDEAIPHKGAVAFGTMTLDINKSIFFGQPLIDAYSLQEEIKFYGTILHATAEKEIENHKQRGIPFIKQYFCPFKGGSSKHLTIEPLFATWEGEDGTGNLSEVLRSDIKELRYNSSGHIRSYIDQTEKYFEEICKRARSDWKEEPDKSGHTV